MFNRLFLKYYADESVTLNPGAGGAAIAVDTISGISHELVKLEFGADGSATQVSAANPLPVTDAVAEAALASIAAEDFATQTTLAAVLAKLSSDPATQTTLAAILAKLISNPATDTLQTTGNTTLASILAKIIAAPSTEAKQDIIITALNSIDAGTAAALGQALMAASVPVTIASNQSAVPVSVASVPLPSGAATSANQVLEIADLDLIAASASVLDDWNESDRAKVNLIAGQVGVDGGSGAASAKTQRVILATDQQAVPVTFSGLATDNTQLYSNTLSATGAIAGLDTTGYTSIIFQIRNTWFGNFIIEGGNDNSTWEQLLVMNVNEISMQDAISENGIYQIKATSKFIRINVQNITGSITALVLGRTVQCVSAADILSIAMDRGNNMPLYVAEIETKKDLSKALIPSDAPAPIYGFSNGATSVFQVDTTGYQSVVVQAITIGSSITVSGSNDGVAWTSLNGLGTSSNAPASTISTAPQIYVFPASTRFVRGLAGGSGQNTVLVYLRQQPPSLFYSTGNPSNIASIGGVAVVNAGLGGVQSIGGNVAPGVAPTSNPVPLAIDTSGLTRRILTDTSGRLINSLDASGTSRVIGAIPAAASIQNIYSQAVQDTSQLEGQSMIEIMYQILMELKINNQMMSELPLVLAGQAGKFDDPQQYRNDSTLFAVQ